MTKNHANNVKAQNGVVKDATPVYIASHALVQTMLYLEIYAITHIILC